jgi:UDP-glucose 6-dehydrogenase
MTSDVRIGFIGQGWIGKTYSDDFERRGYPVVRYAKEEPYLHNAAKLRECNVVFIAVPTPTTPAGFDASIVESCVGLVADGTTVVIKSTLLPGTTEAIQKKFPNVNVTHSPEFLSVATAQHDAENPVRNIIGLAVDNAENRARAAKVMAVLPKAPYELICGSREAELIKYGRNALGFVRVVFINLFFDLATKVGADWDVIRAAMSADPDCGPTYMNPLHKSGRGAGGECFIKDFEALSRLYKQLVGDENGQDVFDALTAKNIELLLSTQKDLGLLRGVHGDAIVDGKKLASRRGDRDEPTGPSRRCGVARRA